MTHAKPTPQAADPPFADSPYVRVVHKAILRLVKTIPERLAIEAGQIDAIIDSTAGNAILLPQAQLALLAQRLPQARLEEKNRVAAAALDALATAVGVLDHAGTVVHGNAAWRSLVRAHAGIAVAASQGGNYLYACDDARGDERVDALAIAAGIRQVLAGERGHFRYEFLPDSVASRCWLTMDVLADAGENGVLAVVCLTDNAESKRAGLLLGLDNRVARCLAESASAATGLEAVMRAVCETMGWDCGRYFHHDRESGMLCFGQSWSAPGSFARRFLEESRALVFRPNAGSVGRVFQSGLPLWVLGGSRDSAAALTALAPDTGELAAFAFPVTSNGRTIGVLDFSSRAIPEPDDKVLLAVQSVGKQLGRFLQQQEELGALRRSEARFRRLTEIAADWYWVQDSDFRFTELVGATPFAERELLGKTAWEMPQVILDDARWAEHKSQLDARWAFCDFEFTVAHPAGPLAHYSVSGAPVYDQDGTFTGYCGTGVDITRRRREESSPRAGVEE